MGKIRKVIRDNKSAKQDNLIAQLNPIITGWSTYHQETVAKNAFSKINNEVYLPEMGAKEASKEKTGMDKRPVLAHRRKQAAGLQRHPYPPKNDE
jgi:hypothetical protein